MKIAVISDVHANLEALRSVLGEIDAEEIFCLGDLVDYGAQPNEAIQMVRASGAKCLLGNHDWAALTGDTSMFNARPAMASIWTRKALTRESADYLRSLPPELKTEPGVGAYFTHGSPDDRLWEYVEPRTHSDLFPHYLDKLKVRLVGLGHTHLPYVWSEGGRTVFNPGSVGQPRDGDPRAAFATLTIEAGACRVEVKRVEYDVGSASKKILDAGLPRSFAERLHSGV
ncbi:MAG: metallophosphoesterase family protein [Nitrososphaerota archaeon]|nr:metallophosphoesterase family protein [Nitrososphaerota archaeon]